jgi:hypothetical protein
LTVLTAIISMKNGGNPDLECPNCGEWYAGGALRCPACGEANPTYERKRLWAIDSNTILRLLTVAAIAGGGFWILKGLVLDPLYFTGMINGPGVGIGALILLAGLLVRRFLA